MTGSFVVAIALASMAACTRDAVSECETLAPGDLIVTEFRGDQTPDDTLGTWVELFNTSPSSIDLLGIKVRFRKLDGSDEVPIIVRRSVVVAPGAYAVIGLVADDATRPDYIDYGFANDFDAAHVSYLAAAAVDVETCGERIDRAVYNTLPKTGTYSFGGSLDADSNDIPAMWCVNDSSPGTPQQANPPCM